MHRSDLPQSGVYRDNNTTITSLMDCL